MATKTDKLVVDIDLTGAKLSTNLMKSFNSSISNSVKSIGNWVTAMAGAYLAVSSVTKAISAANQQLIANRKLTNTLTATGNVMRTTTALLNDMANALLAATTIGDLIISRDAISNLLTFKSINMPDVFLRATKAALDMSAQFGGDLRSSAIQLGKALEDPIKGIGALARVGVTFSAALKLVIQSLILTGRTALAQRLILKALLTQFGGAAAAMATDADKLKMRFNNAMLDLGNVLLPIANAFSKIFSLLLLGVSTNLKYFSNSLLEDTGSKISKFTVNVGKAGLSLLGLNIAANTTGRIIGGVATGADKAALGFGNLWGKLLNKDIAKLGSFGALLKQLLGTGQATAKLSAGFASFAAGASKAGPIAIGAVVAIGAALLVHNAIWGRTNTKLKEYSNKLTDIKKLTGLVANETLTWWDRTFGTKNDVTRIKLLYLRILQISKDLNALLKVLLDTYTDILKKDINLNPKSAKDFTIAMSRLNELLRQNNDLLLKIQLQLSAKPFDAFAYGIAKTADLALRLNLFYKGKTYKLVYDIMKSLSNLINSDIIKLILNTHLFGLSFKDSIDRNITSFKQFRISLGLDKLLTDMLKLDLTFNQNKLTIRSLTEISKALKQQNKDTSDIDAQIGVLTEFNSTIVVTKTLLLKFNKIKLLNLTLIENIGILKNSLQGISTIMSKFQTKPISIDIEYKNVSNRLNLQILAARSKVTLLGNNPLVSPLTLAAAIAVYNDFVAKKQTLDAAYRLNNAIALLNALKLRIQNRLNAYNSMFLSMTSISFDWATAATGKMTNVFGKAYTALLDAFKSTLNKMASDLLQSLLLYLLKNLFAGLTGGASVPFSLVGSVAGMFGGGGKDTKGGGTLFSIGFNNGASNNNDVVNALNQVNQTLTYISGKRANPLQLTRDIEFGSNLRTTL